MKNKKNYLAFIAGTKESKAFNRAWGKTKETAIAAVKRQNSPAWEDCIVWCVYVHDDGQMERM